MVASILSSCIYCFCLLSLQLAHAAHKNNRVKNARKIGIFPEEVHLPFSILLPSPNQQELDQFLKDLYNPKHEMYQKYLQPHEFAERFAPKKQHHQPVLDFLESHNLTVISISENQFFIFASGSTANINRAFKCKMEHYLDENGRSFHSPNVPPQIPPGSKAVVGLHNATWFQHSTKSSESLRTDLIKRRKLKPFSVPEVMQAYNYPTQYQGSNQVIALVEFDNYFDSDIAQYVQENNLPTPSIMRIFLQPTCIACCIPVGCFLCQCTHIPNINPGPDYIEVTLDIELVISVIPKAQVLVYIAANVGSYHILLQIAADNKARVVSTSWCAPESDPNLLLAENTIFQQMASQGQTVVASSGDTGGSSQIVNDPSSQPYVTGVGKFYIALS